MIIVCKASGFGGGGGGGGGYGSGSGGGSSGRYGSMGGGGGMPIPAAIQSRHNVQYYDVPSTGMVKPTSIEIGASHIPINFLFRSASSQLNVQQKHQSAQGSNQESSSEDEPHVLSHQVKKPIYQEVKEVISPYRKITQEIKPVQEEIETIVSRNKIGGGYGGSSSGGYGGGSSGGMSGFAGFGANKGRSSSGTKY